MEMNQIFNQTSENMSNIPDNSVDIIVTSPPYNINISYGNHTKKGKIISSKGKKYKDKLEEEQYQLMLNNVFQECKRVLKKNGSIWINIKNRLIKGEINPPFWLMNYFQDMHLQNLLIWNFDWGGSTNKRFAPRYEFVFWYINNPKDFTFNIEDVKIPALNYRPDRYKSQLKNPSDVWRIPMVSGNFEERTNHPAQYPEALINRIILAGSNVGDVVLDPFMGSGTTAVVAKKLNRKYLGYELEEEYIQIANQRLDNSQWGELLNEN